jgi:hypothetical protein
VTARARRRAGQGSGPGADAAAGRAVAGRAARAEPIPVWAAPALYAIVCVLLFREVIFGGATLLGVDSLALSYFARDFYTQFVQATGRFPLWNPLLFGGLPFVDGMHGDIFYPPSLAFFWLDARWMWGWKMILHIYLAGLFALLWLRGIGLGRGAALFGGLVYMLGAQQVSLTLPGGDGKLFVAALAPLVFWLAERAARRGRLQDFAAFALGITAIVLTSHMQLAYFCIWGVSLYFLFRVWQRWRAERSGGGAARLVGLYALAGVLGVGAAAVQFYPPFQYLREWSHRTERTVDADPEAAYAYSTSWSLHPEEIAALVVPEFVGDNAATELRSGRSYWGRNPFKLNHEYAGFIPLLLLPLAFLRRREPRAWFFAGLGALSLLYALGAHTPFFRLFYLIPGVSLFRAPSLIIFLYGLSVATLGALGLQRLLEWVDGTADDQARVRRVLWGAAGIFGLLAVLASAGAVTGFWTSVVYRDMPPQRWATLQEHLPTIQLGFWITAALAAAVAGVWEAVSRRLIGRREAIIALVFLAAFDLYRVGRPFVRSTVLMNQQADPVLFQPDESITFLRGRQAAGEVFRVFDLGPLGTGQGTYPQNTLAVHGLEQLAGHHGNELARYRQLIGGEHAENVIHSQLRLLGLLNVGYVLLPQLVEAPGLEEAFVGSRSAVYRVEGALPRAYLAARYDVVDGEPAIRRLLAPGFAAEGTVLLAEPPPVTLAAAGAAAGAGAVEWVRREPAEHVLRVRAEAPSLLVVTDNYYPAWRAEVNGTGTEVLRANFAFRAVPVPAGTSEVRFRYESPQLHAAAFTSAALMLLLLGVVLAGLVRDRRGDAAVRPATRTGAGSGAE